MLRVHAELVGRLDAELTAQHGLPLTAYEVLLNLADAPGRRLRMAELAESVLLSRSGMTRLCDRLEREGLVVREAATGDARGAYAVITDEGLERFRAARRTHLEGVRRMFLEHFDDDELRLLAEHWNRVVPGASS